MGGDCERIGAALEDVNTTLKPSSVHMIVASLIASGNSVSPFSFGSVDYAANPAYGRELIRHYDELTDANMHLKQACKVSLFIKYNILNCTIVTRGSYNSSTPQPLAPPQQLAMRLWLDRSSISCQLSTTSKD